ncbi:PilC/PilY family type IV pilus protein [Granulosicoccus sp. 3-233]|uniref:PilC/PilY family type IV pilus protein n=1 Tax=Granulosicoccus sp. 3-233 TaxID=3417969 RepID=UPI003D32A459
MNSVQASPEARRQQRKRPTTALLASSLISSIIAFSTATADDTEVFFGQVDPDTNVFPNVMFVLDTSGSMNSSDYGYSGTRLERMKSALNTILDSSANVNVGLMRFNGYDGGGAVLYPVKGIDQEICANNDCGTIVISSQVQALNDDMEQYIHNGQMTPSGTRLSMGASNGSTPQLVSFRFQDLDIPSGATITSAELEFTADVNRYSTAFLSIYGHDVGDAPTIGTNNNYLSDQPRTSAKVDWWPTGWSSGNTYQSPDIKTVVQEIIDRGDWCGQQSMAFIVEGIGERAAYAYTTNNASRAPVLRVSYDSDSIPADKGCTRKSALAQINSSADDAYEKVSDSQIVTNDKLKMPLTYGNLGNKVVTRLRFRDLAIPTGATIESASIEFEVDSQRSGSLSLSLQAEDADSAPELSATNGWITGRPLVANPVIWNIANSDDWSSNTKVSSPDLSNHVQAVVNRSGWQSENDIAFVVSYNGSGTNRRQFESYDSEVPAAPKLRVEYKANIGAASTQGIAYKTARDDMKSIVNGLTATGGTPIVAAYYEAVQYMLGGPVDYGTQRGYYRHPYHRVSHPDSYTGGSVSVNANCTASNPQSSNCTFEEITGNPQYISPLADSCQTNHIVFLSDGDATSNTAISKVKNLIGATSCDPGSGHEACGVELATWLDETDHNENMSRKQNISTYTIGFNINSDFLSDIATAGGGTYYDAASAEELVAVFQNILGDVLAVDTSFVAPGSTVSQFNRLTHRNDIYFALFKPDERPHWAGNLKRYYVGADSKGNVLIQDVNKTAAVDEASGYFVDTAKSWWSDTVDGGSVEMGGAASQVSLDGPDGVGDRRVYTYLEDTIPANGVDLTANAQKLHEQNAAITVDDLGLGSNNADNIARRTEILKWARGVDVKDEDLDGQETDVRRHIGDPMHSQPILLNYKSNSQNYSTIFVATNEGLLHAIEHENGTELYAFMPKELLPNINEFYENQQSTKHPYGLDGDLSIRHIDINDNVVVDPGEKAILYVGMRRGGNNYYALDVSDRTQPKLLWQIRGGSDDFEHLGQTWSKPIPTTIFYRGEARDVVIFAGGYDTNQDPNTANLTASQTPDTTGNAIYIVDADTGTRLWAGQGNNGGDERFADMDYSIPSDIRVIDVNGDGLSDQMYVGDMGGQLWRFDFQPFHQSGQLVYGGVIAKLNGNNATDARRFYNEPDVALVASGGKRFLSVSIGSGWRAHPLNERVKDRFYMIRSNSVYSRPEGYGKNTGSATSASYSPITESDLVNVTDDLNPVLNDYGWMLELESSGEKVMSQSVTINNQVIFTSYEPAASGDSCSPAIGGGAAYVLDIFTGAPTVDLDDSDSSDPDDESGTDENSNDNENQVTYRNSSLTKSDRKKTLQQDGIPPAPTALITETDGNIATTVLISTEKLDIDFDDLTQRTYWQDNGRGSATPDEITAEADGS